MTPLYSYEIKGIYPNNDLFYCVVFCEKDTDAMAIAQGLRKVTTLSIVALYPMGEQHAIFTDRIKRHG